ncbi:MAG: type II secretion system protein, partial [Candidatus Paceibacterota bacterium]
MVFSSNKSSFPFRNAKRFIRSKSSFTLIELLIVIGILAILTAAVVLVLNPTELLKQGRDSKRM